MASVTDCLVQLQQLTRQNLDILQAINDAFLSNQTHLTAKIGDVKYAIPSFLSLENKINNLQDNFNNLINAPKTGEATFNLDGNSRSIEVRGYTHAPNRVVLSEVNEFGIEQNDIFKDFLTPVPYITFSLKDLPNDITSVNIKKIIPKTDELEAFFVGLIDKNTASKSYSYADLYKKLYIYEEDKDYIEYDTVKKLPIRKNIGSSTYVIGSIKSDNIDENLDEYITLQLRSDLNIENDPNYTNKLTYRLFDETIEKPLKIGDQLVTFDDSAKVEITEIQQNTNTITVKVLSGEYLNLMEDSTNMDVYYISDLAKLKFYSPIDFDNDKYIRVPLEEDQYVFIAIAPLNDRMNIQAPWGTGVVLNTYNLMNNDQNFKDYYQKNVRNIGDALNELVMVSPGELTKLSGEDFQNLQSIKPSIDTDLLKVVQINKHLNDTATVKNIKSLYAQKLKYNADLQDIQNKIADINSKLSSVSFDDTSNIKTVYTQQLAEYTKTKNSLVTSLQKIVDEISLAANSSDIPIENAKYHIRGFFDYKSFAEINNIDESHIKGIQVQYRYKNMDKAVGNAITIADKFLFSDWTEMKGFMNTKEVSWDNGYQFNVKEDTSNQNEPSFNQIDIAISQGETVDIRLKVIYDYGYPYAEVTTQWSEAVNIEFPQEFLKDVQVLDIISENNSDIETNRFNNILVEQGITEHIGDKIQDQDVTYYHKPENISSGFYTSERRVIPLKDKLAEFSNLLSQLKDEVLGTNSSALSVSVGVGDISNKIYPLQSNNILVEGYADLVKDNGTKNTTINNYTIDENQVISTLLNISITNNSEHTMKLYPMFPGSSNEIINNKPNFKYNAAEYTLGAFVSSGDIAQQFSDLLEFINNLRDKNNQEHDKFKQDIKSLYDLIRKDSIKYDAEFVKTQALGIKNIIYNVSTKDRTLTTERIGDTIYADFWTENKVPAQNISADDLKKVNNICKGFMSEVEFHFQLSRDISSNDIVISKYKIIGIKYYPYIVTKENGNITDGKKLFNDPIEISGLNIEFSSNGAGEFNIDDNNISIIDFKPLYHLDNSKFNVKPADIAIGYDKSRIYYLKSPNEGITFTIEEESTDKNNKANTTSTSIPVTLSNTNDSTNNSNITTPVIFPSGNETLDSKGVWMRIGESGYILQRCNQFMNFRTSSIIGTTKYYTKNPTNDTYQENNELAGALNRYIDLDKENFGVTLYPSISNEKSLICNNIGTISYQLLNPGDTIVIPILLKYKNGQWVTKKVNGKDETIFESKLKDDKLQISKTISFDLLPSLYQDPINYEFTVICKNKLTDQDRALMNNRKYTEDIKYTTTVTK